VGIAGAAILLAAGSAHAQILPWEITACEIEAGRLRGLVQRLAKHNVLYGLHLGDSTTAHLVETADQIDRVLQSLQQGQPSYSILPPWTAALRQQLDEVDRAWGPVRRIAVASPYDRIRVSREFVPYQDRRGDPLLLRYFDDVSDDLIAASEKLLDLYHDECTKTGLEVCATARTSGYAAMVIERATKEAIYIVAGIDAAENRKRLKETVAAYQENRRANNESPFFAAALDPERGPSAIAARALLASLRDDWDAIEAEFSVLAAGDEKNFDLSRLLKTQSELVAKVDRLAAALVRYASLTYGG
jgi:hypothetical protein